MSELMIKDLGVMVKAELDVQITTAKAYPRNEKAAIEKAITMATSSQSIAESCIYCLVRKGKNGKNEIKGESIRLAEIMASCWGNIHAATRIIGNDGKFITAQGVAWDLENNNRQSAETKRRITTSDGKTYSEDMQMVTGNAAAAIALRNAIFKVVPKAYVDLVYQAAVKHAIGDQKTFESRRREIFNRFNKMGIENERIFTFFGYTSMEQFNMEDVADLIGIGTAIKDGGLKIDKAFSKDVEDDSTDDKIKKLAEQEDDLPY